MFRECYALEKIHGTSANLTFKYENGSWKLVFFSGGEKYENFVKLFNVDELIAKFTASSFPIDREVTIFGEAYGGKCQGMSHTYGKDLKFIGFDVKVGDRWLDVTKAEKVCNDLGIEFVAYEKCSLVKVENQKNEAGETLWGDEYKIVVTNLDEINKQRDLPSVQAKRNGILEDKPREGVVLRPINEFTLNNGSRVIVKHKGDAFRETASPRVVDDPTKLKVLSDAQAVADEWVTQMRLEHVLDKLPKSDNPMGQIPQLIKAMTEDILREGAGEIVDSKEVRGAIGKKTVELFKAFLKTNIK